MNNGKPKLAVADFWGAFSDFQRATQDQDLGSAGVFIIPGRGNLVGGGKDGILNNLNKDNLGQNSMGSPVQPPLRCNVSAQSAERRRGSPDVDSARSQLANRQSRSQPSDTQRGPPLTSTGPPSTWSRRRVGLSISGVRTKCSRHTTTILQRNALPDFEPKGRRSRQETTPVCLEDVLSPPPTARPRAWALSGACTRYWGTANSRRSRRTRRLRRDDGRRRYRAETAFPQRRRSEPSRQYGEFCQILHAGGGEREGLRRDVWKIRSATRSFSRSSSTAFKPPHRLDLVFR